MDSDNFTHQKELYQLPERRYFRSLAGADEYNSFTVSDMLRCITEREEGDNDFFFRAVECDIQVTG